MAATACSLQPRGSPTGPPLALSGDLGEEVAGLRRLLLDALEGISFLSDEVSQLREDNERLRKDHSRVAEQQARIVASLRGEVRFLRDELTRRVAPKLGERPAKSPTTVQCDFSVKPDTPVTSGTTHNTKTLPPSTPLPDFQRDWKLRVVDRAETSSANVTENIVLLDSGAVGYVTVDSCVSGPRFAVHASPTLRDVVYKAAQQVIT
ncbi:hypothetical protein HPB50_010390 [Hyalomma asiaticum]|uniref:Uncharacterized protein n=1 Tax=Hyalomma asiaticum TaxID=266040 RepID=A0ACB7RLG0_HYAAI|nr:hypothetical protein HPB50_010390 [Hyalomma asiaticum]